MRILIVASFIPYPPDSGARIRTWEIARRFQRDHEVVFGLHVRSRADLERAQAIREQGFEVHTGWIDKGLRAAAILVSELLSGAPPLFALRRSHGLEKQLARMHAAKPFDVIQVEHFELARYLQLIGGTSRSVRSMVLHDVLSVSYARMAGVETNPFWKLWRRYHAMRFREYERKLLPDYDLCITVSGKDRDEISQYTDPNKIHAFANCVDSGAKPLLPEPAPGPPTLLFVGLLLYPPNADAARWLIEEIFPRVQNFLPDCRLNVAGADPPRSLQDLAKAHYPAVTLTGRVDSVVPSYASCQVAVVPVRAGGGTRLKILEAMAFGRPVVSTSVGAEGLRVKHGEHLLIADEAEEFAQAAVRLLQDLDLRNRLQRNARALVEEEYSWDRCVRAQVLLYENFCSQKVLGWSKTDALRHLYKGIKE